MRISTSMIYEAGVSAMGRQTNDLLRFQQQVASGRKALTPADDPVGAASSLEVSQSISLTKQYAGAMDNANSALSLAESQLQGAGTLLTQVRTLAIQSGNSSMNNSDRQSIATQLRQSYDQLMEMANTKDSTGQYIFSGFQGNTRPFTGTVENGVSYAGDDGQRFLQISPTQKLAVSDSGNGIFSRIPTGNGLFVTDYQSTNKGTGVIDDGTITDPANWLSPNNSGNFEVRFWQDTTGSIGPANTTYYDLVDVAAHPPVSLFTKTSPVPGGPSNTYTHAYTPGQSIDFNGLAVPYNDFGVNITIKGAPRTGDAFSIKSSSGQSVFDVMGRFIKSLERQIQDGSNETAGVSNEVNRMISGIDMASKNLLTAHSTIGARMGTVESLQAVNTDVNAQYQQTLSTTQDVDMAQAISDLTRTNTQLQAAQQSFAKISQLSLFSYLN